MLKNLKKVAAIVLSFAMAVQFGLADSYYVNAVEEPVEPQQEETTTTAPQEQEEVPTTEEETPQQQEEGQQQPAVEEEQPVAEEAQPVAEETSQDDSTNDENQASNEVKSAPVMAAMLADNPAATYSVEFKDQNGNSLGSKTVTVGNVADQFPGGKETIGDKTYSYIEARVVNATNEKEYTPITYVAVYDGVTYYSTNSVTGSPLDTTSEKLVVVLKEDVTQYSVKYTLTVDGTDKSSEIANYIALEGSESTVDTGTSFSFLVKPNKGFTVKSVKQDGKVLTADGTKYTTRNVVADSTISIELTEKKKAKITFTGSNTKFTYNGKTQNTGNNYSHNLTLSSTYETSVTELNFKLLGYLEWTSNSKELNKLAISLTYDGTSSLTGKSINIPTKPGETVEITLTDSLTAVVKKSSTKQSIGSGQYSYEYNVTLRSTKNIYDDIKITTNFKDSTSAELFVTSIVGVTSIYVNNKELDPSNSDASFINLNSNETYTFKFNVLPGYVPDASKIKVTGTVDGDDIGTVSIKNNTGSDKAKYPYYFTIKAAYGKTDYRIQVTAIQSEYKFVYKADGISSSNKLKGGEETAITAQRPKKENYVFKGWKIDSDESGKVYTSKEVVKVNDLIQYSKWDANENLSKITFTPVWIEADKAQQVTYRVVVHFDDGTEDKVYEATTAPGKDVKVFRSKLDTALGIDADEYYVDPNQSFDLQNVKDGDTITINYCKRKEIVVNSLDNVPYNGESQKQEPVVTIKDDNSKVLQKDIDYTLSYSKDTKNVGTVTVTVTGKGLYKGTQQVTYQITPRPVTVTGRTYTKVYGTADPELEADVENLVKGEKIDYAVTRAPGNDVGDYAVIPSGEKDQGNYEVTYKNGKLTITKAEKFELHAALSAESRKKTYDGNKLEGAATATVTEGTTISYSVDGGEWTTKVPSIKNVKKVTVKAKAENPNYETPDEIEYTLEITKRPVTVTGRTYTKVYGTADPELEADVENLVKGEKIDYAVTRAPGNDVGDYAVIPSGEKDQGNYEVTYKNGKLTITKAEKFELHAALSAESRKKTYDGNKLEGAATATVTEGTTISYSVDGGEWTTKVPSIKNVKKVTVKAKAENPNYETPDEIEYTLEITKRPVTVTGRTYTKVYGTADPELEADVENLVKGEKIDYAVTRAPGNDVGDYAVIPSGEKDQGNYEVTYKNGKLTITKAETMTLTPELTGKDAEKTYDSKPLSGGAKASVKEGTKITYSTDGGETWSETLPSITDVGTLNVKAKAENKNYKDVTVDYTLKVTRKAVTVTADNKSKLFGETDPKLTATVAGTLGDDKVDYTLSRKDGEAAGKYEITVKGDKLQGNYTVTYVAGTLTITSQSIDPGTDPEKPNPDYTGAKVNSPSDKVYDGKEHKWLPTVTDKADKKLEAGIDYTVEYSTKNFKDVGTVEVTITGKGNYSGTVKRSYKVTPKEYTVTTDSATKTYSGTALTAGGKVEGIVSGETVEFTTTGSQTEVGTSKNTYELVWKSAKATNYTLAKESIGKLTVKAKSIVPDGPDTPDEKKTGITVSEPSDSKYDGKEHKEVLTVTDTKIGKELVAGTDYSVTYSSDLVNAGTVKVTVAGLGNYSGSFTKTYKITKRSVTLTSATVSKVYDGSALTNTSITVSGDGFVEGEGASYEVTGTQTEVGNSANAFEYKLNEKTLASNYNITKVVGTLTITAAPAPVTPATPSTPSTPSSTTSTTSTTPRTPSAPQVTTPAETVEKETTPKAEPKKEEKVEEEYTPKASPQYYCALINLICAILTVLFGLLLLISKRHKSEDDDEEDDDETKQQTNNDDEEKEQEKKRGLFTRVLAVLIAIVSVVFFLVTEDLSLPWTWTDQWTIWMVVIGLVQIVVFFVGRKWKNVDNDDEDEEAQQA